MKIAGIFALALVSVLALSVLEPVLGATYRYLEKDGTVGYTDDLQMVPEASRRTAVLISGEARPGDGPAGSPARAHEGAQEIAGDPGQGFSQAIPAGERAFSTRLLISVAVVGVVIVLSAVLGNLVFLRGRDQDIHAARVMLTWLVVIYLVIAHGRDVLHLFKLGGSHVSSISRRSAEKGEKAGRAIKALDTMIEHAERQNRDADRALQEAVRSLPQDTGADAPRDRDR